jgi:uncharacterized protein (TIGR02466 family)
MNLDYNGYFITPIYSTIIPEWVNPFNKACDKYIKEIKIKNKGFIKNRNRLLKKDISDFGLSHHSVPLINKEEFKEFQEYIGLLSNKALDHMGYDLTNHELFWTDMWVQEFAKKGGGHHEGHIHADNHISGFYFLKCSEKTSFPVFQDPRLGKIMTQLPIKNDNKTTFATGLINYKPIPGTLIIFPSFLEHQFTIDYGIEPFRFIHFNLQAVRNMITNVYKK